MPRASDIPRLLAIAGVLLLAACSDAFAPETAPPRAVLPSRAGSAIVVTGVERTSDSLVVRFTVTPSGGWFAVGSNAVWFPPNAICEPATSGYGPATWDQPCTPATRPIPIVARTSARSSDRGWVHFDTDLRFVPSDDPARWVQLYMWSSQVRRPQPPDFAQREADYAIFWLPSPDARPVDESVGDETLRTRVLWGSGIVTRRVKHFSGYQVGNGRAATTESVE
jgi:hypothetical protein